MIRKTSVAAALIGMAALAAHGSASAESIPQDAINLSNAKLSLPEAVALAEKHHPGSKANQAELRKRGSITKWRWSPPKMRCLT